MEDNSAQPVPPIHNNSKYVLTPSPIKPVIGVLGRSGSEPASRMKITARSCNRVAISIGWGFPCLAAAEISRRV